LNSYDPAVRYLLNSLSAGERERMQARLFADDAFAELLEEAERELLDAYARGELSPDLRQQVETEILTSERQRDKLAVARALAARRKQAFGRHLLLIAAAAVIIAGVASYWTIHSYAPARSEQVRVEVQATVKQGEAARAPAILLVPGALRGGNIQEVRLPADETYAAFDLVLPGAAAGEFFDAFLAPAGGPRVWSTSHVAAAHDALSITIPIAVLRPGVYRLTVSTIPLTFYYFRVR
jgi:anti-sigma factor RsiW